MRERRWILRISLLGAVAVSLALWGAVRNQRRLGDLGPNDGALVRRLSHGAFNADVWKARQLAVRGEMVADLVRRHRFEGRPAAEVVSLLGPGECYIAQDGEPCYFIELGGVRRELLFQVDQSDKRGIVSKVELLTR